MTPTDLTKTDAFEAAVNDAAERLNRAETADDVRAVWAIHVGTLGHKTLARILTGADTTKMIAKRFERDQLADQAAGAEDK